MVKTGPDDEAGTLDFSKDGKSIFLISSVGSDTNRVLSRDLSSGAETVLAQRGDSDIDEALVGPLLQKLVGLLFGGAKALL